MAQRACAPPPPPLPPTLWIVHLQPNSTNSLFSLSSLPQILPKLSETQKDSGAGYAPRLLGYVMASEAHDQLVALTVTMPSSSSPISPFVGGGKERYFFLSCLLHNYQGIPISEVTMDNSPEISSVQQNCSIR